MKMPKVSVKKAAKAAKQSNAARFYTQLRNTPLLLGNCRAQDFLSQEIENGKLPRNLRHVWVKGKFGTTVSTVSVNSAGMCDLNDGRLFNLKGLNRFEVVEPAKALKFAKKHGNAHTIQHGPKKVQRVGFLVGDVNNMYVGFVSADGKFTDTLETRTLPNKRNVNRTFALIK